MTVVVCCNDTDSLSSDGQATPEKFLSNFHGTELCLWEEQQVHCVVLLRLWVPTI